MGGQNINQEHGLSKFSIFFQEVQIACLNENVGLKFPGRHCFMHSIYLKNHNINYTFGSLQSAWLSCVCKYFSILNHHALYVSVISRQKMNWEIGVSDSSRAMSCIYVFISKWRILVLGYILLSLFQVVLLLFLIIQHPKYHPHQKEKNGFYFRFTYFGLLVDFYDSSNGYSYE